MLVEEIYQIAYAIIVSLGGGVIIVFAASSWLGKVWASRILERERVKHQKDIEHYKNELNELKIISLRYSGKQFELYNEFWGSLCDLENSGDFLITQTDDESLERFKKQFKVTSLQIKKSYLFIEKNHFNQLQNLLNNFKELQVGREKLLEMREIDKIDDKRKILKNIVGNFITQQNSKKLINEIGSDLKKQLRGIN